MIDTIQLNLLAFVIFVICVTIYVIKLKYAMIKPGTTKRGLLNLLYSQWVEHMATQKSTIVPVQTMRNLIMSVTFLSTAIMILLGLLVQFQHTGLDDFSTLTNLSEANLIDFKNIILFTALTSSLITFLLSLRHMVRFSIIIGLPCKDIEKKATEKIEQEQNIECQIDALSLQKDVFIKAMNRFTYGIRALYYSIILLFWFMGPFIFMAATIVLTIFLIIFIDVKAPSDEETPI